MASTNLRPDIKTSTYNGVQRYRISLRKNHQVNKTKTFPLTRCGLKQANEFADAVEKREKLFGSSAWSLNLEQMSDATRAFRLLKEAGSHLTLEHSVKQHLATIPKYTCVHIHDAYEEYKAYKENNFDRTYEKTTIKEATQKVKRFCNSLEEGMSIDRVTDSHIYQFLDGNKYVDNTRRSYYYSIRTFFHYCKNRKWCRTNPTDNMPKLRRVLRDIHIIKPVEYVQEILDVSRDVSIKMFPMVAMKFFAGVRTKEVSLLEPEHVDLRAGFINMPEWIGKTGSRMIKIEDNLKKILHDTPLEPNYKWSEYYWVKIKDIIHHKLDYNIVKNSVRRSFVTYLVAKTGSIDLAAKYAGSSVETLNNHYKVVAAEEDGFKYFSST